MAKKNLHQVKIDIFDSGKRRRMEGKVGEEDEQMNFGYNGRKFP